MPNLGGKVIKHLIKTVAFTGQFGIAFKSSCHKFLYIYYFHTTVFALSIIFVKQSVLGGGGNNIIT